ncbi:MAG TPA: hypothetical protein VLB73_01365 [Patescibacteria group bacterium]|nr:hypothetical protein [Patescibacteria group bacterium]
MQPNQDYKQLLTDVIKKQIVILGPDITLSKARNVKGLTVANDGTVTNVEGSAQEVTQALIDQFVQLSGLIVKKTMEPLLSLSQPTPQAPTQPQMAQQIAATEPVPQPVLAPQPIPTQPTMPTEPAASPTPAAPQQAPIPTQPPVNNPEPQQPVPATTAPTPQPTISEPAKNPLAA